MTAATQSTRGSRYEHIIFRQRSRKRRRVNFAPAQDIDSAGGGTVAGSLLDQREQAFLRWLFEQAGLDLRSYRPETLHRRLAACLRMLRVNTVMEARAVLLRHPAKIGAAVGALVIGVTSLFRDSEVFDHLASTVLPALPQPPHRRRIWSVGCSDGDEVYSVAILLAEMGLLRCTELLATDCRGMAIENLHKAVYTTAEVQKLSPRWLDRFFVRDGADWRVAGFLRQAVQARIADVTRVREPGVWDLILCRNMAMYLRPAVAADLWAHVEQALRPGGFLVLGKAERPEGCMRLSLVAPCIYRRDRG